MEFIIRDIPLKSSTSTSTISSGGSSSITTSNTDYLELVLSSASIKEGIIKKNLLNNGYGEVSGTTSASAIYFIDNATTTNGWIFNNSTKNIASLSNNGDLYANSFNFSGDTSLINLSNDNGALTINNKDYNSIPTIQSIINGQNQLLLINPDGGNVNIGNSDNTGEKLQVNGKVKSKGLVLKSVDGFGVDITITNDDGKLNANGNPLGAKILKHTEIINTIFSDEDIDKSVNAYTVKKLYDDKFDKAGGTISGNLNITGNLTVNGSSITNLSYNQIITALGYTPYNASINQNGFVNNSALSNYLSLSGGTISGNLIANSFIKSGGISSQFLKADGTVDSNSYALASQLNNYILSSNEGHLSVYYAGNAGWSDNSGWSDGSDYADNAALLNNYDQSTLPLSNAAITALATKINRTGDLIGWLQVGTGSNTKINILDGGYLTVNSINTNDNIIIKSKNAGAIYMNYGNAGASTNFYNNTTSVASINSNGDFTNSGNITTNGKVSVNNPNAATSSKKFEIYDGNGGRFDFTASSVTSGYGMNFILDDDGGKINIGSSIRNFNLQINNVNKLTVNNTTIITPLQFNSTLANGTTPFLITSSTKVNNLNVDAVDNFHFWSGTKAQYDAIVTKNSNTVYIII